MSEIKGHNNLTKENSVLLERVNALENKVREIDEEQINGIKGGTSIRPTLDYLEERVLELQLTTQNLQNKVREIDEELKCSINPSLKALIVCKKELNGRVEALERTNGIRNELIRSNLDILERHSRNNLDILERNSGVEK